MDIRDSIIVSDYSERRVVNTADRYDKWAYVIEGLVCVSSSTTRSCGGSLGTQGVTLQSQARAVVVFSCRIRRCSVSWRNWPPSEIKLSLKNARVRSSYTEMQLDSHMDRKQAQVARRYRSALVKVLKRPAALSPEYDS